MLENSLETDRLILRRYRADDLMDLYSMLSDEKTVEFEPYRPMNLEDTRETLEERIKSGEWIAVELKETGRLIGNIYLETQDFWCLEIGYMINRKYLRQGYALEACEAIVEYARKAGAHRMIAQCDPKNISSWKLLEKLGFRREAHFEKNVYFWLDEYGRPIWKDTLVYARVLDGSDE